MLITEIKKILGTETENDPDEIWNQEIYFRIQPKGLTSNHNSTTSNNEEISGLHVFQTFAQAMNPDGAWDFYGDELVLIKYTGSLIDTDDVEGFIIPAGSPIIARFDYEEVLSEYEEMF